MVEKVIGIMIYILIWFYLIFLHLVDEFILFCRKLNKVIKIIPLIIITLIGFSILRGREILIWIKNEILEVI
jgi:hypothetical protein